MRRLRDGRASGRHHGVVMVKRWWGRLLCGMRLHRWRKVILIDRFDLAGVTLTRDHVGGSATLHGRVARSHTEHRCRRCDRPRSKPRGRDVGGMHRVVGDPPKMSARPPDPPPPGRPR